MDAVNEWDQLWLPLWPLASNDLMHGIYRTSRPQALDMRYIETNPHALSNLLVVDIDHPDATLRALSASHHPMPTAVVENPRNGHAHAVWALQEPVTRTEYARRKPVAYAAAVTEGLRRATDGDAAYSGLITKNPTHESWVTHWVDSQVRSLDELAEGLGTQMPPTRWRETKTRRANPIGLGRNCALFESARHWAYREIRHHWHDSEGLALAIQHEAAARNAEFPDPLPASEVRAIAASIHRWIVTYSRMWADGPAVYEATFVAIQSARSRKGTVASAASRKKRVEELQKKLIGND